MGELKRYNCPMSMCVRSENGAWVQHSDAAAKIADLERQVREIVDALGVVTQEHYEDLWRRTLDFYLDPTAKINSGLGIGPEYGDKLREIASTPLGAACLKAAFWEAYRHLDQIINAALEAARRSQ